MTRGDLSAASDSRAARRPPSARPTSAWRPRASASNGRSRPAMRPKRARGISRRRLPTPRCCSNKATFKAPCGCWRWRRAWTLSTLEPCCSLSASRTPSPNGKPPTPPNASRRTVDELLAAAAEHLRTADQQPHDAILAMRKITEALALAPDHAGAQALKADSRKSARGTTTGGVRPRRDPQRPQPVCDRQASGRASAAREPRRVGASRRRGHAGGIACARCTRFRNGGGRRTASDRTTRRSSISLTRRPHRTTGADGHAS